MAKSGKGWVPPSKPGEQEWVWDYVSWVPVEYPTKFGHWVRACPNGAVQELHRDSDHTSGKPSRWGHQDCKGDRWERPFDKETFGNEWRDDRWWQASGDGSNGVGTLEAKEYLTYCMRAAPSLMRLVTDAMTLDSGSFEVTVPYVIEDDGGWNTAGFPESGEDCREVLVPLLTDHLEGPSVSAVLTGPSLPTAIAKSHSDQSGALTNFARDMGDRIEQHWTLFGLESGRGLIRHAVRFASSFVFDMGLLLDVDLRQFSNPEEKMGKELPSFIAEHVTALYAHGPSYDGYLIWRKT